MRLLKPLGTVTIGEPRWHSGWGSVLQIKRSLARSQLVSLEIFIDIKSFRSHYGPGVDSASNRNEYQEHLLEVKVKGGRCVRLTTLPPSCAVVMKSGNLNFLEHSGPLQACNGTSLLLPYCYVSLICGIVRCMARLGDWGVAVRLLSSAEDRKELKRKQPHYWSSPLRGWRLTVSFAKISSSVVRLELVANIHGI
jgi:hypothetical protein